MSKKQIILIGALMALCVAIGALLVTDFNKVPLGFAGPGDVKLGADNPPVTPTNELRTLNDAFVAVSKAVTPQVVSITVTSRGAVTEQEDEEAPMDPFEMFERFRRPPGPQRGAGSGVVITPDGYIMTNNHVVEGASPDGIRVEMNDGREFDARLIGRDPLTDLAVIKVETSGLQAAAFANSDDVQVGQLVIAVGNPLGLSSTVTQGIVSALGRGQLNLNVDEKGYGVEDFIQTDAAINPGNSGGGLFDLRGALVGINSAIATQTGYYQGYGFAIPINLARAVAQDLIDDGKVNRGYIGVEIKPVDEKMAKGLKLPNRSGVLVNNVLPGGAGATAGLQQSDVILEIDGHPVNAPNHLQSYIAQKRAGDDVRLKIFRDGRTIDKTVRLKPREEESDRAEVRPSAAEEIDESAESMKLSELGMEVSAIDAQTRRSRNVTGGVEVTRVDTYGEAMNQGISRGDIIISVNRKPVNSPAELRKIVSSAGSGDILLMQVRRKNGGTNLVAVEVK